MGEPGAALSSAELWDLMPCGVAVLDARGLILKVNATLCRWLGYDEGELVGQKKLQELFTMGGRIFHQTHWLPSIQMQGSLAEVKFDLRCRDGRLLPMMLNAVRRREAGATLDLVTLAVAEERNKYERELVAARQRADALVAAERANQIVLELAQARLRQAMRVASIHLWDVDPDTLTRHYEADVAQLLGGPPRAVADAEYRAAIVAEDAAAEGEAFAAALRGSGSTHSWTYRLRGLDGTVRVVVSAGQAVVDAEGALLRFVGVLRDITETTRLREQAEDRALFAEQMIGIVSHDLRNPLTAILVGAQILRRGDEVAPARRARLIEAVQSSAKTAQRLVEDLLDFTAARVGRGLSVTLRPGDLHAAVARVVDDLTLAFPGRTLRHVASGEGECSFDADRIGQLLGNLVGNATAYGDPSQPVTIFSSITAASVTLAVHNAGPPIPVELQATMFEPMVRGHGQGHAPSLRSVGLGLYIVRQIATAHGGEVGVRSSAEGGTVVSFVFPAGAAPARR